MTALRFQTGRVRDTRRVRPPFGPYERRSFERGDFESIKYRRKNQKERNKTNATKQKDRPSLASYATSHGG